MSAAAPLVQDALSAGHPASAKLKRLRTPLGAEVAGFAALVLPVIVGQRDQKVLPATKKLEPATTGRSAGLVTALPKDGKAQLLPLSESRTTAPGTIARPASRETLQSTMLPFSVPEAPLTTSKPLDATAAPRARDAQLQGRHEKSSSGGIPIPGVPAKVLVKCLPGSLRDSSAMPQADPRLPAPTRDTAGAAASRAELPAASTSVKQQTARSEPLLPGGVSLALGGTVQGTAERPLPHPASANVTPGTPPSGREVVPEAPAEPASVSRVVLAWSRGDGRPPAGKDRGQGQDPLGTRRIASTRQSAELDSALSTVTESRARLVPLGERLALPRTIEAKTPLNWPRLLEQVQGRLELLQLGARQEVALALEPEGLGGLLLTLSRDETGFRVEIQATRLATAEDLGRRAQDLHTQLERSGLSLVELRIEGRLEPPAQPSREPWHEGSRQQRREAGPESGGAEADEAPEDFANRLGEVLRRAPKEDLDEH